MMFTCLLPLFLDPSGEAADPRFGIHVFIAPNQLGENERGDVMFVLMSVLFMTLLSKPTADLAVGLSELVADVATMLELP